MLSGGQPRCRRPPTLVCYICGREFGTTSLKIHQPKCAELFLKREALKPKRERRKLPEPPSAAVAGGAEPVGMSREEFNEQALEKFNTEALMPCPHCGRTFFENPLKIHLRSCRPDTGSRPVGAKQPGGGGGAQHRGKSAATGLQPSPTAPSRTRASPRPRAQSRPQGSSRTQNVSQAHKSLRASANEAGTGGSAASRVKQVKRGAAKPKQSPRGNPEPAAEGAAAERRRGVNLDILRRIGSPKVSSRQTRAAEPTAEEAKHSVSRVDLIQMVDEAEEQELLTEDEAEKLHVMIAKDSEMLRDVFLAAKSSSKNPIQRFAKNARRTLKLEQEA